MARRGGAAAHRHHSDDDDDDSAGAAPAAPAARAAPASGGRGARGAGGNAERLRAFWASALEEVGAVQTRDLAEFKNHQLPLARIKKIMKSDEDVRMISAEAPVLFAKACELFILELSLKAWMHAEAHKRRTLGKADFVAVVQRTETLDFLRDVITEDDNAAGGGGAGGAAGGGGGQQHEAAAGQQQQQYGGYYGQ